MFSISTNIKNIEEHMAKLREQATLITTELVRLDGSLSVFRQMSDLGIESVPLPKDEVLESIDWFKLPRESRKVINIPHATIMQDHIHFITKS